MRPGAAASGSAPRWSIEKGPQGSWTAVVTEIPFQVPKGKLIEQIAALIADRKLPILADVRDESDAEIRIVIEPRSRTVEPELLMDSLFRLTDLEARVPLNLNVLDAEPDAAGDGAAGRCCADGSPSRSRCWSAARSTGSAKIDDRLELLEGYLIAFLNLDRVIQIIRTEDEPKPVMIAEFALTDRQAEAILNMRLRSLAQARGDAAQAASATRSTRRRDELEKLVDCRALPEDPAQEGSRRAARPATATETELGRRRTLIEEAAPAREIPLEAMIEREPITVILSKRGWIRAMKGHVELDQRRGAEVQGRRRARLSAAPRPHHRQDAARLVGRPLLHARRRQAAGRARLRRAGQG